MRGLAIAIGLLVATTGCLQDTNGTARDDPLPGPSAEDDSQTAGDDSQATSASPLEGLETEGRLAEAQGDVTVYEDIAVESRDFLRDGDVREEVLTFPGMSLPAPKQKDCTMFEDAVKQHMGDLGATSAVLAVADGSGVWCERGYGWKDPAHTVPMPEDAVMRISSISKVLTHAAILQLESEGDLFMSQPVFCVGGNFPCILDNVIPDTHDARLEDITVQHLIDHEAGFDIGHFGRDPAFSSGHVRFQMGLGQPPTQEQLVEYFLQKSLWKDPGADFSYSNFGYIILGLVIEDVSGLSYEQYIQTQLVSPLSIFDIDMGNSPVSQRHPKEGYYVCSSAAYNIFAPGNFPWPYVCNPDGGYDENMLFSAGGLLSSAGSLAWFGQNFAVTGVPIMPGSGSGGVFFGSQPGQFSQLYWDSSGLTVAAIFNNRLGTTDDMDIADLTADAIEDYLIDPWLDPEDLGTDPPWVATIWAADDGPDWVAEHHMDSQEYQDAFESRGEDGFRVIDISGYERGGVDNYAALWVENDGTPWVATHGVDQTEFDRLFAVHGREDYILDRHSIYVVDGERLYAGVWIKDPSVSAWVGVPGLSGRSYQDKFDEMTDDGYCLHDITGYPEGGTAYWSTVWRKPCPSGWAAVHGLSGSDYQDAFEANTENGLRLTDVSAVITSGGTRYAALWESEGSGPWRASHGLGIDGYQLLFDEMTDDGYRPVSISVTS